MRTLKYHERTLLKKVDFLQWKGDDNIREVKILRRYHIQDREEYHKYNRLCGTITKVRHGARCARLFAARPHARRLFSPFPRAQIVTKLKELEPNDPYRLETTDKLLEKLHTMGVIHVKKLSSCDRIAASTFCRRRLPVVLVRLRYAENLKEAITLIEQGHIRIGPETVSDPAYLVTRQFEDLITWVDTSKIKRHVMRYNDQLDDYDML
jgi:U3 small nucleolar ribonucleoprotein protein IMP3